LEFRRVLFRSRRHPPDAARRSRGRGAAYRGPRAPPPVRSLVVILVYDFGVDDVVIVVARAVRSRRFGPGGTLGALCSGRLLLGVQGLTDLLAGLAQRGLGRLHGLDVIAFERGLELLHVLADLAGDILGELVGVVGEQLLRGVGQLLGRVAGVLLLAALGVLGCVLLGFLDHAV